MPLTSRVLLTLVSTALLVSQLAACANPGRTRSDDPWQSLNRKIYRFNDTVDRAALKPIAKTYKKITPNWTRIGISNFFANLELPRTIINELLQAKLKPMTQDTGRLILNTTIGIAGFINVANHVGLSAHDEDFGQTLAVWGVPSGPYLVLPFLGPSTLRDGPARVVDYYSQPQHYADIPWETETGLTTLDIINLRTQLLSVDETLKQAYDAYGLMRDAWMQRREYLIFDGNPPIESLEDEFLDPADSSETAPN